MPIKVDSIEFFPVRVTAITPTGDRPLAFALCKHWMEMQTVKPDQWIVVDDGKTPMKPPVGATYVRRTPQPTDPKHTLNVNLKTVLPYIRGEKILIIEDDEYYAPGYVEAIVNALDKGQVAGISWSKYYHLPIGGYVRHANTIHASLAQTGFTRKFMNTFTALLDADGGTYLDLHIWRTAINNGVGYLFTDDDPNSSYLGIKGLPGRTGIGIGHKTGMYKGHIDTTRSILKTWVPQDYKVYLDILSGKLNDANCDTYFPQITGITVCQNTKDLIKRSYESIRKFHPEMPIIIIDGSDSNDPCYIYTRSLQ
ncbi:MAG: glycosyltransferase family A protein, partial [Candidatus Omnitrophota bacterium]